MSLLAAGLVTGNTVADTDKQIQIQNIEINEEVEVVEEVPTQLKTVKDVITEKFGENSVLVEIAHCESRYRQFDKNGSPLRGKVNRADVGVFQINEKYHAADAVKLGHDIYTLEGNIDYAKYLYDKFGTDPWVHSKKCWNDVREVALVN